MRGVVMSVKGKYAVLLNKDGEFVKVRNKNYTVGSAVSVTSNTGRICAMAASFLVVCGGIGSYFTPAGYVSVDINPSFLLTLNVYNKVIDIDALNDDAVNLLEKTDVKGKNAEDSVDMLIKTSEEIGYLNENNNDVIVEVVSGIRDVKFTEYSDVEVVVEKAEKSDLHNAKEMGVSIAKARAIKDYTTQNGGTVKDNAQKLVDKSVKEIRKGLKMTEVEISLTTPAPTGKVKEVEVAKTSSKKKLSIIGGSVKKEEKTKKNSTETTKETAGVKPSVPVTEIFRTPAPHYVPENEKAEDKEKELTGEKEVTNTPSFPNHIAPQLQENVFENNEENTSGPQQEKRDNNRENETVKEEKTSENNKDTPKSENQNNTDTDRHESKNPVVRQEVPMQPQQSGETQNNSSESNEGSKTENSRTDSSKSNSGSGNAPSDNDVPSAPSAPSHSDSGNGGNVGGNDSGAHGGNDGGKGGFGGSFGGEFRER